MKDVECLKARFNETKNDTARQLLHAKELISGDKLFLEAAVSAYEDFCIKTRQFRKAGFAEGFLVAWAEFSINALSNVLGIAPYSPYVAGPVFQKSKPYLFILWHFPEYPLLMPRLIERRILTLTAQDSMWLAPLRDAGLSFNFRCQKSLRPLVDTFKRKQSLAAMLDHHYPGTRSRLVGFMSSLCRTPSGIIELAMQYDYNIALITVESGQSSSQDIQYTKGESVDAVLCRLNDEITRSILLDPYRWLLWPSLNSRFSEITGAS